MEYWDLYDRNRQKLDLPPHPRGTPLPEGCYHLVVHIGIYTHGKFLSTQRDSAKDCPLMWELTGGSTTTGEDTLTAVLREVKEETGLILDPSLGGVVTTRIIGDSIRNIWLFRCDIDLDDVVLQSGETCGARLLTPAEIRELNSRGFFYEYDIIEPLLSAVESSPALREVSITESAETVTTLIRRAFSTVAKEFGLTPQNAPTNPAFITSEQLLQQLSGEGKHCLGLYLGPQLAGFAALIEYGGGVCELTRLAVAPELRHRGYGGMLLDETFRIARNNGRNSVKIGIIDENRRLKDWYISKGFAQTAVKTYPHLPFTVCEMQLHLHDTG